MDSIDSAFDRLKALMQDIEKYKNTIFTESDTRIKVIDRIFVEVLGWPMECISTEVRSGKGFVDYKFNIEGLSRLIVEAKRDGRNLGLGSRDSARTYKLNGPAFNTKSAAEGIAQAIRYCGQKNTELACVTNGREWIIFRGSRLGDGSDTTDGLAFTFSDLDSVLNNFTVFYDLLSFTAVQGWRFRAMFQEAEGVRIRSNSFKKSVKNSEDAEPLALDDLARDLDRVMTSFFRRLSGETDEELLLKCFVVTRQSTQATKKLARISQDLIKQIRTLSTAKGQELTELIDRVKETHRNEFVLIVGTKGAGKSTFMDRFFKFVLTEDLRRECVISRVNLNESDGNDITVTSWLDQQLVNALENSLFKNANPTYEELIGIFYREYKRWAEGPYKPLHDTDKNQFKIEFGKHMNVRREERTHEYIGMLIHDIARNRMKVPVIIFDNADHFSIEFQEKVFQYARSLYESDICLVIVPITDKTSWQLTRGGALQSFENESLFLPTPASNQVLSKRVLFLAEKIGEEKKQRGTGYFLNYGIKLSLDNLNAFAICLQKVFINTGNVSDWISNLSNQDIRQCLELARIIISSPYLKVSELVKLYMVGSSMAIPDYKIKQALIKQAYEIYPGEKNKFVHNIYALDTEIETSPLLGLRILDLLLSVRNGKSGNNFISLNNIIDYFHSMSIEPRVTLMWLDKMLKAGLCFSYDPTVIDIQKTQKIESSPSGHQHFLWGLNDMEYIKIMLQVTPIWDRTSYDTLSQLERQPHGQVWHKQSAEFIKYLLTQDETYCQIPDHHSYGGQKRLLKSLKVLMSKMVASSLQPTGTQNQMPESTRK